MAFLLGLCLDNPEIRIDPVVVSLAAADTMNFQLGALLLENRIRVIHERDSQVPESRPKTRRLAAPLFR